jgi:hypothetical protein
MLFVRFRAFAVVQRLFFRLSEPGGARIQRLQVPNSPGSGKDIAEGKGVHREVESEGSRMKR